MKDHVHKNAVIDLKTQYIDKRAEVEVQLVESSEQVRQLVRSFAIDKQKIK